MRVAGHVTDKMWSKYSQVRMDSVRAKLTAFAKSSVLANRVSGTVLLLRGDGKHYFIKIGDRESMYAAVAVR